MKHTIIHTADIQVQVREKNLRSSYEHCLSNITEHHIKTNADIYVVVGDLFEYAQSNDAEKSIMYEHLSKVLSLESIKEVVIMCGNHDIEKERKRIDVLESENSINTFYNLIRALDKRYSNKLTYLKYSELRPSIAAPNLVWCPFSLEDNMALRGKEINIENGKRYITLFHDILKEYALEAKLPLRKERMESLVSVAEFPSEHILAGDIHVNWNCNNGKQFWYPGSPIQRNFGEGTYCKIADKYIVVDAERKSLKQYVFDDETLLFEQQPDLLMQDYVSYITMEVMQQASFEQARDAITEILNLQQVRYGLNQTFIKLKLSNLFTEHELELHKLITSIVTQQTTVPVNIEIAYNKFVQANTETNVDKILGNETVEADAASDNIVNSEASTVETPEVTAESLVLDSTNLRKLFLYVLEQRMEILIKENPGQTDFIENVYKTIVELFDSELEQSLGDTKKVSIHLQSIECNAFQILGANKINLDIPGIVRITGTNGIGKTTLFSMLRWAIRGQLYEGMPKNTVKKNTMLVFNNKQPDIDEIYVKFVFALNERVTVTVIRTASRTWKAKTTDEQKQSLNWQDYVSGVTTTLTLQTSSDKGERSFNGEQAQQLLDSWYAQTPETIMFLNHSKIASILNTAPKELNQTVLDFIGVDYLEVLESRLDEVKDSLAVARPKRNRDVILEDIRSTEQRITDETNNRIQFEKDLQDLRETAETQQKTIDEISSVIENYGNVPEMISEANANLKTVSESIDTFEYKERKPLLEKDFDVPEEPDTSKLEEERDAASDAIALLTESKTGLQKELADTVSVIIAAYDEKITKAQDGINNYQHVISEKRATLTVSEEHIRKLKTNLSNTICPTCHRPFADDEQHAAQRKEWEAEIEMYEKGNEEIAKEIEVFESTLTNLQKVITELRKRTNLVHQYEFEQIIAVEQSPKIKELLNTAIETTGKITAKDNEISEQTQKRNSAQIDLTNIINDYGKQVTEYNRKLQELNAENERIQKENETVDEHNRSIEKFKMQKEQIETTIRNLTEIQPKYFEALNARNIYKNNLQQTNTEIEGTSNKDREAQRIVIEQNSKLSQLKDEEEAYTKYFVNNTIYKIYDRLIKQDFKSIVFEYYRNFLNNNLNNLLEEQNFKLFWNHNNELYMIDLRNGRCSYTPVQLASGMEVSFLGLSLIYTMSCLNIKNHISHIFLDEIGGSLNDGKNLNYEAKNYQELFVSILSKFTNITMFIIDHTIKNMYETVTFEVQPTESGSKYVEL